jgi:hypothetical protein
MEFRGPGYAVAFLVFWKDLFLIRLGPAPVSNIAETGVNTVAETPKVAKTF